MPYDHPLKQVFYYRCRGTHIPLLSFQPSVSCEDFRKRIPDIHVQRWHEDGLGPHCGFLIRLSNGLVVQLAQNDWEPPVLVIYGDSLRIVEAGLNHAIHTIIDELAINPILLEWQQTEDGLTSIHQGYLTWLSSRQSGTPVPQ